MRKALVLLHRWAGLAIAGFLFVAGLTGAVIAWDHELDAALNPHLYAARSGPVAADRAIAPLTLARRLEAADPRLRVTYLPLAVEPGHTVKMGVAPGTDAAGRPYPLAFNEVAVDPADGRVQGLRMWGEASLSRENLLPFLYKLHYSLHLPAAGTVELGVWLMGLVGLAWALDCLVALWLAFPKAAAWRKSFAFRWREGGHRLTFDLHRSGGVWVWGLLLVLAVTSVSMNLGVQVVRPIVERISPLTPSPFASRAPAPFDRPIAPVVSRERVLELGRAEAARRGWAAPAGAVFYAPEYGVYGVGFFAAGNDHGDGGLGNPWLYFDGRTGALAGADAPGQGSAGDLFMQAQFPLHSGRILGVAGRVLVSALGLTVAILSLAGVLIWLRKRRSRLRRPPPRERTVPTAERPGLASGPS